MSGSALSDILVLDLSRVLAGPYCTMLLGDYGARVIKVEQPGRGDDTRRWGPPFTASGESAYFLCANRNKESITVNLAHPEGQQIIRNLAARADVVVENFQVGSLGRFGLDFGSLHELNPRLIYCSITGYGQTGPYAYRPGYDSIIQAQGGIMSITGPEDKPGSPPQPYKVGVAIVDISAGLHAATAILAALHARERTGMGQHIDIALFDTQLSWLANVASNYLVSGETPRRYGNAHASIVPYQTFDTSEGVLMLAVGNDAQFVELCAALDVPELAGDTRFATNQQRVRHRVELIPRLASLFAQRPARVWVDRLLAVGVPCSVVNDIPAALADEQAVARAVVQYVEHPTTGTIPQLGPVAKMNDTPPAIRLPPPTLGQDTSRILSEFFGYTKDDIEGLMDAGVI